MFSNYWTEYSLMEYNGQNDDGSDNYSELTQIKALRTAGKDKITHGSNGETVTTSRAYKVERYIQPHSKFDGQEVESCEKIEAFGLNTGYMIYLK